MRRHLEGHLDLAGQARPDRAVGAVSRAEVLLAHDVQPHFDGAGDEEQPPRCRGHVVAHDQHGGRREPELLVPDRVEVCADAVGVIVVPVFFALARDAAIDTIEPPCPGKHEASDEADGQVRDGEANSSPEAELEAVLRHGVGRGEAVDGPASDAEPVVDRVEESSLGGSSRAGRASCDSHGSSCPRDVRYLILF